MRAASWRWDDVALRPLHGVSASALADYHARNRTRLRPFSPTRAEAFYTARFWRTVKRRTRSAERAGVAMRWALCDATADQDRVIGLVSLDQIVRGAFQSASLGYSIDEGFESRGLMKQAVEHVVGFAFGELGLHRISADHLPDNERSAGLLAALGFEREGYARQYLKLDGVWRDHVLNALVAPSTDKDGPNDNRSEVADEEH